MRIHLTIADASSTVESFQRELAGLRARLARKVARRVLERIIERTPVETGRLRAAWARAFEDLGGTVSGGSSGGDAGAIAEGAALGSATVRDAADETEIEIENTVPYAAAIEHGTRRRAGAHIVPRALDEAAAELRGRMLLIEP